MKKTKIYFLLLFSFFQFGLNAKFENNYPVQKFTFLLKPLIFADFFSPNGDGHNDVFYVENLEEYPINKLFVFNRWGEIVYTAEPYNNDWDGTMNINTPIFGDKLPDGMYFYRFEYLIGDFLTKNNGKIILKR